jgi:hypothetical protein
MPEFTDVLAQLAEDNHDFSMHMLQNALRTLKKVFPKSKIGIVATHPENGSVLLHTYDDIDDLEGAVGRVKANDPIGETRRGETGEVLEPRPDYDAGKTAE